MSSKIVAFYPHSQGYRIHWSILTPPHVKQQIINECSKWGEIDNDYWGFDIETSVNIETISNIVEARK